MDDDRLYILVQCETDDGLEKGVETIERILRGEPVFYIILFKFLGNYGWGQEKLIVIINGNYWCFERWLLWKLLWKRS